jgi:chromosomal replication initiation ATPase DnaA
MGQHRLQWKKKTREPPGSSESHTHIPNEETYPNSSNSILHDGNAFRVIASTEQVVETHELSIRQYTEISNPDPNININQLVEEFTLNKEQARAFRIVAEHSMKDKPSPLRMYLGGPGGTGKSRVINALKEFFDRRNQSRRFRLSSYTGVAARNISGMTLHTALCLSQQKKMD